MKKNEFLARKTSFEGVEGYMVSQLIDGEIVCKQFIREDGYEDFCEAINTTPRVVN